MAAGFDWPRWEFGRHSMSRPMVVGEVRERVWVWVWVSRIQDSTREGHEVRRVWMVTVESRVMA